MAVAGATSYAFNHNLGMPLAAANVSIGVFSSPTGDDGIAVIATPYVSGIMTDYGYQFLYPAGATMWKNITILTKANPGLSTSNVFQTTGIFYKLCLKRGW